ncbi:vanadium-dependent haloperoxidase [bacterium]|nr:vanadium-dependent haloperoxidase [bacterium]
MDHGHELVDPSIMHYVGCAPDGGANYAPYADASAAYQWLDILEECSARSVERVGARPTILSREMAIVMTAMYDAWAAYDDVAVGTRLGGSLRRPEAERTRQNKETAMAYACHDTLLFVYPEDAAYINGEMRRMGYDISEDSRDPTTAIGVGHLAADALIEYRTDDGANQLGNDSRSNGEPYSDYTGYMPVNPVDQIIDPNRWQPITFTRPSGEKFTPGYLTPQWGLVKPFALESGDQFRPGPPPRIGSEELKREVDQCIRYNATLTPEQISLVEFMRDGPRSTGQSGHWLRFAQDLSRRDHYGLDEDVKLFFSTANVCLDTFIACWDAKTFYDSSRPWTLVHYYYGGSNIQGWKGPGAGVGEIRGEDWHPYSPATFVTPPFPGYPSGHSTVSSGGSRIMSLFSGTDLYGFCAPRVPGSLTGEPQDKCIYLECPTWSGTAAMAGQSRIMGGYHIQADNVAALELGRKVAEYSWPIYQSYFDGTASVRN